jgi:hypothetical protein
MISKRNTKPGPPRAMREEVNQMTKMSIRKAGTIRLTAACCYIVVWRDFT